EIEFVSYPYEWCFSQLQDAALLTLEIQKRALASGLILKDASAYNVQFWRGRPVLIDTLSFERHVEGLPWLGYAQFCRHFLAPLALMTYCDVRLSQLLRVHLDGIPLDLATALLPARAWLRPSLLTHIRVHASFQRRFAAGGAGSRGDARPGVRRAIGRRGLIGLAHGLEAAIRRLRWQPGPSEWSDYEKDDSYSAAGLADKRRLVAEHLKALQPARVWDLGANTGAFSRLAAEQGAFCVAFDGDPLCVERSYAALREAGEARLLPLLQDLTNPSPALGWDHGERAALAERAGADLVMALALIHHLAISNNVPLERVADLLVPLAEHAIVEFVPKQDAKVRVLLASREDVFPAYTRDGFEAAFGRRYEVVRRDAIEDSQRILYLLRRR
ncbi:MAG: class I SAM-dependent methyltransferase, partial [Proteobacteria bacterium]|nr:class I SAM-dependent methyltransferase [Pseudomonadota bacterium]